MVAFEPRLIITRNSDCAHRDQGSVMSATAASSHSLIMKVGPMRASSTEMGVAKDHVVEVVFVDNSTSTSSSTIGSRARRRAPVPKFDSLERFPGPESLAAADGQIDSTGRKMALASMLL